MRLENYMQSLEPQGWDMYAIGKEAREYLKLWQLSAWGEGNGDANKAQGTYNWSLSWE